MKRGFTLIELLVVVLIIGILSAVVLPMYQGAVDKSRFSTLLPATKGIKDAQESVRAATGLYTDNMDDLEISMENEELNFTFDVHNNLADPNLVRTTSPKLENVRLASYFDYNPMMAGQKHCEAKTGDKRANRLCGPLLQGQDLGETGDGYTRYLLDEDIDKPTCDGANRSWSSSKGKCYKDDPTRCDALGGMGVLSDGQCGYENTQKQTIGAEGVCLGSVYTGPTSNSAACRWSVVNEGGICKADSDWACSQSTIKDGGICLGNSWLGCHGSVIEGGGQCIASEGKDACRNLTVQENGLVVCEGSGKKGSYCGLWSSFDGAICVGNGPTNCVNSTFTNGSICYANATNACGYYPGADRQPSTFDETSCCCGAYCPNTAPKCAASRCDPQYMK